MGVWKSLIMKKTSNKIVFFGSGPVATASLRSLSRDFDIEAVVTKPATTDEMSEIVPQASLFAAKNRTELENIFTENNFRSTVGVLVDYGVILSQKIIDSFPLGIVNSHFSLLPEWRGADPITFFVLSGAKITGVSLMLLVEAMDEGPLLAQAPYAPAQGITTPQLTKDLVDISNQSLREILPEYIAGKVRATPQDLAIRPTYSRKLTKQDGLIDWTKPAQQIEREIRAFLDWPKSFTKLNEIELIIRGGNVVSVQGVPGKFKIEESSLTIFCGKDALKITKLQPAGKKEMDVRAFLAGYKDRLV